MNLHDVLLPLHLFILGLTVFTILRADSLAFAWMRGNIELHDKKMMNALHHRMWYGLLGMIVTGFTLFWPLREFLLTRQQFYVKMAFVLGLSLS